MKKFKIFVAMTFFVHHFANAQPGEVVVTGPTCIAIGDTVVYKVSKAVPGYQWGCPMQFMWLHGSDDNTSVTYLLHMELPTAGTVWYGPMAHTSKGGYTLQVYSQTSKPEFSFTTEEPNRRVVQQIPKGTSRIWLNIHPPGLQMATAFRYELSGSNDTWTFGNNRQLVFETGKTIAAQRIAVNVGSGNTTIKIKTTGGCDSRIDTVELVKME